MISKNWCDQQRMIPISAVLFMLLLVPYVSAQAPDNFLAGWPEWLTWSAIIIGITCILIGIALMVSRLFVLPSLEAWVHEEIGQIIFTVFIIILFSGFAGMIEETSSSLAVNMLQSKVTAEGQTTFWIYNNASGRWSTMQTSLPTCPYPCHIYIARGFLGSTYEVYAPYITGLAKEHAASTLVESLNVGSDTQWLFPMLKLDLNYAVPLYPARSIYNNTLEVLLTEIMKIIGLLKFQEIALVYLTNLSVLFFISGILLRIPFFTRKLGGLLLALAIGIYVIFPLAYLLGWYTLDRSVAVITDSQMNIPNPERWGELGESGVPGGVGLLFTKYDAGGYEEKLGLIDVVGRAYTITTILPILSIFLTIGFVRHFSPMIGGDTELAGLTKLI